MIAPPVIDALLLRIVGLNVDECGRTAAFKSISVRLNKIYARGDIEGLLFTLCLYTPTIVYCQSSINNKPPCRTRIIIAIIQISTLFRFKSSIKVHFMSRIFGDDAVLQAAAKLSNHSLL